MTFHCQNSLLTTNKCSEVRKDCYLPFTSHQKYSSWYWILVLDNALSFKYWTPSYAFCFISWITNATETLWLAHDKSTQIRPIVFRNHYSLIICFRASVKEEAGVLKKKPANTSILGTCSERRQKLSWGEQCYYASSTVQGRNTLITWYILYFPPFWRCFLTGNYSNYSIE